MISMMKKKKKIYTSDGEIVNDNDDISDDGHDSDDNDEDENVDKKKGIKWESMIRVGK